MYKLIRLEFKKIKIGGWLRNIVIANVLIALWVITSIPNEDIQTNVLAFASVGSYVRITFIIFSAVFMARIVIDEYRNKTISVLFTYPIRRQTLIIAKLITVSLITFWLILLSNFFATAIFLLFDHYQHYIPEPLTTRMLIDEVIRIFIWAIAFTGLSLIPFFVGMLRKSIPATIVTSFVTSIGFSGVNLDDNWLMGVILAAAIVGFGILTAYFAIRNIERIDL
ncbi:ABC transporter permease [Paenibacillus psychroresistens]|nr:ABC transporter permease [Paenibacillus psychroresistens]